jgi:hypothetical protein
LANESIRVGRLLRSGIQGFDAGFSSFQNPIPEFGALLRAEIEAGFDVYGIIHNINVEDDGLVRQMVTTEELDPRTVADNRANRNVPMEIGVLSVGYQKDGAIKHLLPPQIPLSMTTIFLCGPEEVCAFTGAGRFGYLRHILRNNDLPVSEIIAAHIEQAGGAHRAAGNTNWEQEAIDNLISSLRDDYPTLMMVMDALSDIFPGVKVEE